MAPLPARPRIGFLASHNASNMRAIVKVARDGFLSVEPVILISNNKDSQALAWAKQNKLLCVHISATSAGSEAAADAAIAMKLKDHRVHLVVLAGYMRKLGPKVLAAFPRRILNTHPALLPKFGGKGMYGSHVHAAVLKAKETQSGATIHLVDDQYDHGPIVAQSPVPVSIDDTVQTLADRVQAEERVLFLETVRRIVAQEIDLDKLEAVSSKP